MAACDRLKPLAGFTVGVTADRRREEQAELLRRRGANVVFGAAIHAMPLPDAEALAATRLLLAEPPDILVATTGVGVRMWFALAEAAGLDDGLRRALSAAEIFARGPKARGALEQLGLRPARTEPTELLEGLTAHLLTDDLAGHHVAVQLDGGVGRRSLLDGLEGAGARVTTVSVYACQASVGDHAVAALARQAARSRLSAVTFTSPPAVDAFFAAAAEAGLADGVRAALNGPVVATAVGPFTAETVRKHGVVDPCFPEAGRLGLMIRALTDRLARAHQHLAVAGRELVVQGSCIVDHPSQTTVELRGREQAVFQVLAARPSRVVSRASLLRQVWPDEPVSPSAVDTVVRRLRTRVRPVGLEIRYIQRRGFALQATQADCD